MSEELDKLTIDELIKMYKEKMHTTDVQVILKEKKNRPKEEALKFDKEILSHYLEVFKDE